jgi:hypothetical protein
MTPGRLFQNFVFQLATPLVLALLGAAAMAQADPPGRVARLNHPEGTIVVSPAGDNEWTDAELNRPLTRGDRLWTDRGSRAEIQIGSSAVRMDGRTHLEILALDDQTSQLSVTQGVLNVRVRSLPEGENFEIDTPNLAYRAAYPGDYRIDVDAASGTTRVTIHSGTGAVYGESGQALPLGGGQQVTFRARSLAQVNAQESPPQDAFDRWAADRNRVEDQSISARYVPREVVGYQQLDANGQWAQDATHGMVWYPRGTAANWAPYRHGHWEWISPWGWTWIDDAPWGFAPFHYGRWALISSRWAWVPGHLGLRPLYAPALVAFIGNGGAAATWKVSLGAGRPGVAWFPLGPGEAWQPGYRASPVYISNVNRHIAVQDNATYAHQRHQEALTAVSAEDFHRGRPVRAGFVKVAANTLSNSQVVPPPPMPEGSGMVARERATPLHVAPPASAEIRQVITKAAQGSAQATQAAQASQASQASQAPQEAQAAKPQAAKVHVAQAPAQQEADAQSARQSAGQEKEQRQQVQAADEQTKASEPAKQAQAPKPAPAAAVATAEKAGRARSKEQVKHEQVAKRAEPAKREQVTIQAAQAKRERQATRAEQAKREQVAARAEQAKREQVAARAEQAKREHLAARAEQAKREQIAARAEQVKREQVAARAEQAKREQIAARTEQVKREQQVAVRSEQAKRAQLARRVEQNKREQAASRAEQARQQAKREQQTKREQLALRVEQSRREAQARSARQEHSEAQARRDEQLRREAHAQRVEQARRNADRDAEVLRDQRARREELARREAQEREQAQREVLQRQQQALADQQRRDQQLWERQQRERVRQRPDLRDDRRAPPPPPEVWQRGIPILNPGRTS